MFNKKNNSNKKKLILSKILKVLKWIFIGIIILIVLIFTISAIGKAIYNRTPKGGINESMHVEINNSTQWISIYGQDINNPVILYLHGGPGYPTSTYDYKYVRKWSDIFTVVTWDQRNCGLSYSEDQNDVPLTYDLFMKDGIEVTKYIINYLHKDKITLIGHSWGTYFGCNLILKYPEYYNYYIGTGQLIDVYQNEVAFLKAAREWSKGDEESEKLVKIIEEKVNANNLDMEYQIYKNKLETKYGYNSYDNKNEKPDYNRNIAYYFNPYHSLLSVYKFLRGMTIGTNYEKFFTSPEFEKFSLLNRTEYQIPYYNINGDCDYATNNVIAENYFNMVKAPRKKLYTMKNMAHGLLEIRSGEFSNFVHDIAKLEQTNNTIAAVN